MLDLRQCLPPLVFLYSSALAFCDCNCDCVASVKQALVIMVTFKPFFGSLIPGFAMTVCSH